RQRLTDSFNLSQIQICADRSGLGGAEEGWWVGKVVWDSALWQTVHEVAPTDAVSLLPQNKATGRQ
ncbi:hypothetical protein BaRGS_00020887, partial [Batillaria attramentaria]